jgi:hypothetical protein
VYGRPKFRTLLRDALDDGFSSGATGYARDTILAMSAWPAKLFDPGMDVRILFGADDRVHSPDLGMTLANRIRGAPPRHRRGGRWRVVVGTPRSGAGRGGGYRLGARVSALAGRNAVLVSSTLRDLVIGSGLAERSNGGENRLGLLTSSATGRLAPAKY